MRSPKPFTNALECYTESRNACFAALPRRTRTPKYRTHILQRGRTVKLCRGVPTRCTSAELRLEVMQVAQENAETGYALAGKRGLIASLSDLCTEQALACRELYRAHGACQTAIPGAHAGDGHHVSDL